MTGISSPVEGIGLVMSGSGCAPCARPDRPKARPSAAASWAPGGTHYVQWARTLFFVPALAGGDVFELLFAVPRKRGGRLRTVLSHAPVILFGLDHPPSGIAAQLPEHAEAAGVVLTLENHYIGDYDGKYLVTAVEHEVGVRLDGRTVQVPDRPGRGGQGAAGAAGAHRGAHRRLRAEARAR